MLVRRVDATGMVSTDNNGARLFTSWPLVRIYDQELRQRAVLYSTASHPLQVVVNPIMPNLAYFFDGDDGFLVTWRLDLRRQVAESRLKFPNYYVVAGDLPSISSDGEWLYVPITQTGLWPPSKLAGIHLGRAPYSDSLPPSTSVSPLEPTQTKSYWQLEWQGADSGSGIDHFEVWSKEGDKAWQQLRETPNTWTRVFASTPDDQYCFRVVAVDRAGNVELFPREPDTCTIAGSDGTGLSRSVLPAVFAAR